MSCYSKVYCFNNISDEDMKLILETRLPCAIRRSGVPCSDPYNYKILSMHWMDEDRGNHNATYVCVEIELDEIGRSHKYYFRVYPTVQDIPDNSGKDDNDESAKDRLHES